MFWLDARLAMGCLPSRMSRRAALLESVGLLGLVDDDRVLFRAASGNFAVRCVWTGCAVNVLQGKITDENGTFPATVRARKGANGRDALEIRWTPSQHMHCANSVARGTRTAVTVHCLTVPTREPAREPTAREPRATDRAVLAKLARGHAALDWRGRAAHESDLFVHCEDLFVAVDEQIRQVTCHK